MTREVFTVRNEVFIFYFDTLKLAQDFYAKTAMPSGGLHIGVIHVYCGEETKDA